jgi:hypothetical protein
MTNMGAHTNYRKVALAARAPFFKWASANDLLAPDYLKQCVAVLESRPDVVPAFGSNRLFEHDLNASTAYDNGLNLQDDDAFVARHTGAHPIWPQMCAMRSRRTSRSPDTNLSRHARCPCRISDDWNAWGVLRRAPTY